MRYDKEHKERTRQRLLAEAAAAIRAAGPEQLGVASLMSRLGLTHGGFYAHFKSKEDLVDQAIAASFDQARERFLESIEGRPAREGLAEYIDFYLSAAHVGAPEAGCPLPALSTDLSRLGGSGRERFAKGVNRSGAQIAALLCDMGVPADEAATLATSALAEMVGAVSLARAATDPDEAARIIANSRKSVKARLGLA